ncbi:uncharacterized protein LOC113789725 [Dermatophagoides pteronyssinus]|uniref:uncharacterized protein LOC113789725 n=1 Tax=Dermatophagoides pteronyssinus TaxID=6956 RepID=UPI003F67E735
MNLKVIIIIMIGLVLPCLSDEQWPIITTINVMDIQNDQESIMNVDEKTPSTLIMTMQPNEESKIHTVTESYLSSINTVSNTNAMEQTVTDFESTDSQTSIVNRINSSSQIDNCLSNQTIAQIEKIVEKIITNMKLSIDESKNENIAEKSDVEHHIISTTVDSIISTGKTNIDNSPTTTTTTFSFEENITENSKLQQQTTDIFQVKSMNRTRVNIAAVSGQWLTVWIWLLLLQIEILLIALIAICILMRKNFINNNNNNDDSVKSISKYDFAFDNNALINDQSANNLESVNENCSFPLSSSSSYQPPEIQRQRQIQMNPKRERFQRKLSEPLSTEKPDVSSSKQYWLWGRPNTPILKSVINECRL